ncbi:uncharacterized protein METZ01_LOCUS416204, partial [marine metagenome]
VDKIYYDTVTHLECSTDREYIQGWVGGYLGNPEREEQRQTDAYRAGYEDGKVGNTDRAKLWKAD